MWLCSWVKKTVFFLFPYLSGTLWRLAKPKGHPFEWFMPSRPTTLISKTAHSSSCSDLDSEVTVLRTSATDLGFDAGLGKTLRIGDFSSLDQSAHVYLYWSQSLTWRPSIIRSQVRPDSRLFAGETSITEHFGLAFWAIVTKPELGQRARKSSQQVHN